MRELFSNLMFSSHLEKICNVLVESSVRDQLTKAHVDVAVQQLNYGFSKEQVAEILNAHIS